MSVSSMHDYLVQGTAADGRIRCLVARTTRLTERARRLHGTFPVATAALGRTLTAALMLSKASLKGSQRLTLRLTGEGPLRGVIADADAAGTVRGYVVEPKVDLPLNTRGKLDVGGALIPGRLTVSRDLDQGRTYSSTVDLVSGEIGDDVALYLRQSEQIPSAVALGVHVSGNNRVDGSGGLMLQLMPGGEDLGAQLEEAAEHLPPISDLMRRGASPEEVFQRLLEPWDGRMLARQPLAFRCTCSLEKVRQALVSLGEAELRSMAEEDGGAEVRCHFCNRVYHVPESDLLHLRDLSSSP